MSPAWKPAARSTPQYLGEESFKDKLLAMMDRVRDGKNPRNVTGGAAREHGVGEAMRLVREMGKVLELPTKRSGLEKLRKSDERKVLLAALLKRRTTVGLKWISEKLVMGHPGSVSRLIGGIAQDRALVRSLVLSIYLYLRTILTDVAAFHGLTTDTEPSKTVEKPSFPRLSLIGRSRERDRCPPSENIEGN